MGETIVLEKAGRAWSRQIRFPAMNWIDTHPAILGVADPRQGQIDTDAGAQTAATNLQRAARQPRSVDSARRESVTANAPTHFRESAARFRRTHFLPDSADKVF